MGESAAAEQALSAWGALILATPRVAGMMILIPFMRPPQVPAMARNAFIMGIALLVSPEIFSHIRHQHFEPGANLLLLSLKEAALGLLLGFIVGFLFHVPQAIGDFIDNQRGASIASLFNPALGEQSSNLGLLLSQCFLVWFLSAGGMERLFAILFASYDLYPVASLTPLHKPESLALIIKAMGDYLLFALLLAGPVIFPMLVAEIALGLVSRFAPQLNVFFIAMPLKSVISLLILLLYLFIFLKHFWGEQTFFESARAFLETARL